MKRQWSLAAALLIALVSPLASQFRSPDCLTDKRCPSGVQPPKCCEPPPCQFFAELWDAKAKARFFTRETFELALKRSGGDAEQALQYMMDAGHGAPVPAWCNRQETIRPRLMKIDKSQGCAITTIDGKPLTREDAHSDSRSCPEYLDAEYDLLELRREYCLAGPSRTVYDTVDQYRHEYQVQADRLQRELQEHWMACSSPSTNPWARREMEAAGVDMSPGGIFTGIDLLTITGSAR
jgi:hypothetical protein